MQEQADRGFSPEETIASNVITRAVGIQPNVQVDTLVTDLQPGDLLLLCSDGLHGYLRDGELDLAVVTREAGDVVVVRGDGRGDFEAPEHFPAGGSLRAVVVEDFDRDDPH